MPQQDFEKLANFWCNEATQLSNARHVLYELLTEQSKTITNLEQENKELKDTAAKKDKAIEDHLRRFQEINKKLDAYIKLNTAVIDSSDSRHGDDRFIPPANNYSFMTGEFTPLVGDPRPTAFILPTPIDNESDFFHRMVNDAASKLENIGTIYNHVKLGPLPKVKFEDEWHQETAQTLPTYEEAKEFVRNLLKKADSKKVTAKTKDGEVLHGERQANGDITLFNEEFVPIGGVIDSRKMECGHSELAKSLFIPGTCTEWHSDRAGLNEFIHSKKTPVERDAVPTAKRKYTKRDKTPVKESIATPKIQIDPAPRANDLPMAPQAFQTAQTRAGQVDSYQPQERAEDHCRVCGCLFNTRIQGRTACPKCLENGASIHTPRVDRLTPRPTDGPLPRFPVRPVVLPDLPKTELVPHFNARRKNMCDDCKHGKASPFAEGGFICNRSTQTCRPRVSAFLYEKK